MADIVSRIVEVCVLKTEGRNAQYLLLKRSEHDSLYPGLWQFVTGTLNEGERAVDAAVREFREETGMMIRRIWVVPFVNSFYVPADDSVQLAPFFAIEVASQEQVKLSSEHQEYLWCSYNEARDRLVWPGQRYGLQLVQEYFVGGQEASRLLTLSLNQTKG